MQLSTDDNRSIPRTPGRALRGLAFLAAIATPLALPVQATTATIETRIERVMTEADGRFGGCMAALAESPSTSGLNCPAGRWVTFSCTGEHTDKSSAMRMFDAAQLAFVTERPIRIWVDDTRKHGGHCFAWRLQVLQPKPS